jgi:23S rRNA pseudouridine1911/1915/1917 synthase
MYTLYGGQGARVNEPFIDIGEPRIVYEHGGIIVAAKPAGMHCAPVGEPGTLCTWLFRLRPGLADVVGHAADEGGLLHRLDSATSGLVAFACDDAAFAAMARGALAGRFRKTYRAFGIPALAGLPGSHPLSSAPDAADLRAWEAAVRSGVTERVAPMLSGTRVSSRFRPYGPKGSRVACAIPDDPVACRDGGKAWTKAVYTSDIGHAETRDGGILAEITLTRGFRHQIRAQMAWIGLALKGDHVYGDADEGDILHLQASRLEFEPPDGDPLGGGPPVIVDLDACQ